MNIRDIFRYLESTLNGVRIGHDKIQRKEAAVPVLNSPNFVDPADKIDYGELEPHS